LAPGKARILTSESFLCQLAEKEQKKKEEAAEKVRRKREREEKKALKEQEKAAKKQKPKRAARKPQSSAAKSPLPDDKSSDPWDDEWMLSQVGGCEDSGSESASSSARVGVRRKDTGAEKSKPGKNQATEGDTEKGVTCTCVCV